MQRKKYVPQIEGNLTIDPQLDQCLVDYRKRFKNTLILCENNYLYHYYVINRFLFLK